MTQLARPMPQPTAQVAPFFDVLGLDLTITFLLAFGGADLNLSENPRGGMVEALVGYENARALGQIAYRVPRRIPLAKRWLTHVLAWKGQSVAAIARTLRVSEVSVRAWLKEGRLA